MLRDCRARVLVVSDALHEKVSPAAVASPFLRRVVKTSELAQLLAAASPDLDAAATCPDDVAFWLYSSGSTGAPKGAVHLHSNLVETARLYGTGVLGVNEDDVVFSAAKLFFAYGLGNGMTFPLHAGATAVLMAERPTAAAVMRTLKAHQPSIFGGVPTLFASILADPSLDRTAGSPRLRVSISAGEALPRHVGERWRERFGTDILDGIGSTEMLHIFLSNRHGDVRYGTSGKPVPGYDVKLVDSSGEPVADGEEGALWVRGPSACAGYWNQREKSLGTFHGPWTRTGDRYTRDADGYYTYGGRDDDMLKVGGIWVSPFEVESALGEHDAVLEAAVVGHPDDEGLVKPRAFVVLKTHDAASEALAAELKAFVKGRLAPYKYPRWIVFARELPKTATGKIQRYKLRAG
jgi:benzoate-CoA ligase family protein